MKKTFICVLIGLILFGMAGMAQASLIVESAGGHTVVKDDVNYKYWLADINFLTNQTYDDQISTIGSLTYFGVDTWLMATEADMLELASYSNSDRIGKFAPPTHPHYGEIYGRFNKQAVTPGWYHEAKLGADGALSLGMTGPRTDRLWYLGAWAVAPAPIPIPGAVWLLGSGLVGLVGLRKKYKK